MYKLSFLLSIGLLFPVSSLWSQDFSLIYQAFEQVNQAYKERLKIDFKILDTQSSSVARMRETIDGIRIEVNPFVENANRLKQEHWVAILCHEVGHIMAGSPFMETDPDGTDISAEGQADYFATAKCMRFIYNEKDAKTYVESLPQKRRKILRSLNCPSNVCMQLVNISYETFLILEGKNSVSLLKKSPLVVEETQQMGEPNPAQCRLDTFVAGAICPIKKEVSFVWNNAREGACTGEEPELLFRLGARPACWFHPSSLDAWLVQ